MADSLDLCNKESSEVASKQGGATRGVASEAGEALSTGVTPDSVPHSQMHNTQGAQAIDIDQNEGDHAIDIDQNEGDHAIDIDQNEGDHARRDEGSDKVVINLDSDEDEDLHSEHREPELEALHAPRAMNGGDLHMERPEPASCVALHAPGAMNVVLRPEQHQPAQAAKNGMSPLTPLWHYVDPQGVSQGPFSLMHLKQWKLVGFFSDDFRVWRTGQTMAQAILLTDAFRMNL
uniref:GYF domain-containing protein n=1 Tax=Arundo donax TaxID=35708 RepID=A0A0A8Z297_ARUDO